MKDDRSTGKVMLTENSDWWFVMNMTQMVEQG